MNDPASYEAHLDLIARLERPRSADERVIRRSGDVGPVGVARSPEGLIEIFLAGPPLDARARAVADALEHQVWQREDGEPLEANRLLLPAAGHFDQVAAFLCTELLRNGAAVDLPAAFRRSEPVIALAIERLLIADESILGLCGELVVLNELARAVEPRHVSSVVDSWLGHGETARDFQLGEVGVEVKATSGQASSHEVQGVHQVEVGHGVDGATETTLLLVSVGLSAVQPGEEAGSFTLPVLVDRLVETVSAALDLSAAPVVDQLLDDIRRYGDRSEVGYDHVTMSRFRAFQRSFRLSFVRSYDMGRPEILVLRSDDVRQRSHVDTGSVRFRVNLPERITGDVNPVHGLGSAVRQIIDLADLP